MEQFAGLALARRLERAEGSAAAAFIEAKGGVSCWTEIGGALALFDGAASPVTQTFGLGLGETVSEVLLSRIEDFFLTRATPVRHEVCPLSGVALSTDLATRGYTPFEMSTVLFLDLSRLSQEDRLSPDMRVRMAIATDASAYSIAAGVGWSSLGDLSKLVTDMTQIMLTTRGYVPYLVEVDDSIIATGGLAIHDGVALFAGASTVPDARGRGAQRALLEARLSHAKQSGCDLAMLVTEPGSGSQRNGERSGFRVAYTRTKWQLAVGGPPADSFKSPPR